MPPLSLVVCIHGERELLQRLLQHSAGCHDDLVVVHDGPDTDGVRALVESAGGRFFERQREFQQEPHWPFAWERAAHDWILRLDADEYPSAELKVWLQEFRSAAEPGHDISGYTCRWPLWNGRRTISSKWPKGRYFLFHRQRVRFFGMAEQVPVPDQELKELDKVLCHEPNRKTYGVYNVVMRKQSYRWRDSIARCLLGAPADLCCWRWDNRPWPGVWEEIRQKPLSTAARRLLMETLRGMRDQWRIEGRVFPMAAFSGPLHHAMLCVTYWRMRRSRARGRPGPAAAAGSGGSR